jgi:hypothetical protein
MKKIIILTLFAIFLSCSHEEIIIDNPIPLPEVDALEIKEAQGLKLESYIVERQVKINTKLSTSGTHRIKIYNFIGDLVSQEKIQGKEGDNILNIYVSALPKGSYTVKLQTIDNRDIGTELFSKQ